MKEILWRMRFHEDLHRRFSEDSFFSWGIILPHEGESQKLPVRKTERVFNMCFWFYVIREDSNGKLMVMKPSIKPYLMAHSSWDLSKDLYFEGFKKSFNAKILKNFLKVFHIFI